MNKVKICIFLLITAMFIGLASNSALAHEATAGPTGVIQVDEEKVDPSYTFMTAGTTSYLIHPAGYLVGKWEWAVGGDTQILANGHFLRLEGLPFPQRESGLNWGGTSAFVREYDGDQNLIWETDLDTPDTAPHHSIFRMPNGNTLVLVWERIPYAMAVDAGRDPSTINNPADGDCYDSVNPPGRYKCDLWPDKIVELGPDGAPTGWEWRAWEHMVQDFDNNKDNWYGPTGVSDHPELIDINYRFPISKDSHRASADFGHANKVDYMPYDPAVPGEGRIILNSRVFGEFYVIDYPSGNIIDRWGNPCAYKQGECPSYMNDGDQKLWGAHSAYFIKPGYPGEGRVLVFDNGWMRPEGRNSRVMEVDLTTGDVVFEYSPASPTYTDFVGNVKRLANGNTLLNITFQGHLIEVTPDKIVAWEFLSPIVGGQHTCFVKDQAGATGFEVRRYEPHYPGLHGKHLSYQVWNSECPNDPYYYYNYLYGEH